jgi:deazaflavin-dependent oxidoreductase (nitroreductase family)
VATLLLEHVGRRSGATYTTPLLYLVDGPDLVVVASQGGLPKNPQWFHNLKAHPETRVRLKREVRDVRARVADPGERAALWPRLVELYADFATYQATTDREIPVVVLSRR